MANRMLLPTGNAREALAALRRDLPRPSEVVPFPRDLLARVTAWEDGPELLHLAWELARCAPEAAKAEQRALVLLAFASLVSVREGSTRTPIRGPLAEHTRRAIFGPLELSPNDLAAIDALLESRSEAASVVLGAVGEHRPLLLEGDWLQAQRLRAVEDRLIATLRVRLAAPLANPAAKVRRALDQVLERPPRSAGRALELSDEQQEAVRAAVARPLTVVTGGPGTGKTSIVVTILRTLVRLGTPPAAIALAAPTGKAANRMDSSVRRQLAAVLEQDRADAELLSTLPPARTLHRLLGFQPALDRWEHHEQNPVAAEVVLVDESSMVDLFLMERLVRALAPGTRLVLLGDAEQLPSVDAGAVFRDLVAPTNAPAADPRTAATARLTRSFRMDPTDPAGRNILTVAQAMNRGASPELGSALADGVIRRRGEVRELAREGVELLACAPGDATHRALLDDCFERAHPAALERLVRQAYRFGEQGLVPDDLAALEQLFAHAEAEKILCVTRAERDPAGTGGINRYLHGRALALARSRDPGLRGEPAFLPGEPVMLVRNDHARGLFNGDVGLVVRGSDARDPRQRFMAAFRTAAGVVAFDLDSIRGGLELAYALTVHKAQGSELDRVVLMLPREDLPLLTRELLYTAVTRARRSAVVAGDPRLLALGIGREVARFSGVGERLAIGTQPSRPRRRRS